jgi:hypothetical protein
VHNGAMPRENDAQRQIQHGIERLERTLARTRAPGALAGRSRDDALAEGKSSGAAARPFGFGLVTLATLLLVAALFAETRGLGRGAGLVRPARREAAQHGRTRQRRRAADRHGCDDSVECGARRRRHRGDGRDGRRLSQAGAGRGRAHGREHRARRGAGGRGDRLLGCLHRCRRRDRRWRARRRCPVRRGPEA